jgi:hypothetical protein
MIDGDGQSQIAQPMPPFPGIVRLHQSLVRDDVDGNHRIVVVTT